jgi:hypothetical protein
MKLKALVKPTTQRKLRGMPSQPKEKSPQPGSEYADLL